jgi:hypothetical protein
MMRFVLFALVNVALGQTWSDWECPGFPCFIVNYFYPTSAYSNIKQTCAPISDMVTCNELSSGTSFNAVNSDGSIAGTHTLTSAHPCVSASVRSAASNPAFAKPAARPPGTVA